MTSINNESVIINKTIKIYQEKIDELNITINLLQRERQTYISAREILKDSVDKASINK